jgi:hypothetical protein
MLYGNYCTVCGNETRTTSETCTECGGPAIIRELHYWEYPQKLRRYKTMVAAVTGFLEMCARFRIEWPYVSDPGPDDDPSIPPTIGYHDCGNGTVELMGYDSYTMAMEEDTYYCSVNTAWNVCHDLQMDLMPESITHKLKGK